MSAKKQKVLVGGIFVICAIVALWALSEDESPPLTWTLLLCGMWSAGVWLWAVQAPSTSKSSLKRRLRGISVISKRRAVQRVVELKRASRFTEEEISNVLPLLKNKVQGWPEDEPTPKNWRGLSKKALVAFQYYLGVMAQEHFRYVKKIEKQIRDVPQGEARMLDMARVVNPSLQDWRCLNYAKLQTLLGILTDLIKQGKVQKY